MSQPQKYVVFDLDNCLADDAARIEKLIDWSKANPDDRYAPYHAACAHDLPGNIDVYRRHVAQGTTPVFMTARPVTVRQQTLDWIAKRLHVESPIVMMRNVGDHRSSVAVKREMVENLWHYGIAVGDVVAAYDDRQDIVDMYLAYGIDAKVLAIHGACAMTKPEAA